MEESEKQSQNGDTSRWLWKTDGWTRALEGGPLFVEDKVKNLTKVLAVETEKIGAGQTKSRGLRQPAQ